MYDILGVPPNATQQEIKRAYLQEAKRVHPDVNPSPSSTARFQALAQAYQVLGNAESRARYDRERREAASSGFSSAGGARRTSGFSSQPPPPPPPNADQVDPMKLFRMVLEDMGVEDLQAYLATLRAEATEAASRAQAGDLQPAKDFAWKHKGFAASVILPAVILLRFPALVFAAFRFVVVVAGALLSRPQFAQLAGQYAWYSWRLLIRRAEARAQARARESKK